jgi:hypothetical protein
LGISIYKGMLLLISLMVHFIDLSNGTYEIEISSMYKGRASTYVHMKLNIPVYIKGQLALYTS